MAPRNANGDLVEHRLSEIEKKLEAEHKVMHDPEKGVLHRLDEVEDVTADVKALKSWAQRLGLAGLSGVALAYWDQIKAALKIGGSP